MHNGLRRKNRLVVASKGPSTIASLTFAVCISLICPAVSAASVIPSPLISKGDRSPNAACCIGNFSDDFENGDLAPNWIPSSDRGTTTESGGKVISI